MEALMTGTLVADPRSGIAVQGPDGEVKKVLWPFGWAARDDAGRLALLDERSRTVAHVGDRVELGGGAADGWWVTCGELRIIARGRP